MKIVNGMTEEAQNHFSLFQGESTGTVISVRVCTVSSCDHERVIGLFEAYIMWTDLLGRISVQFDIFI